jgi:HEAT repeat protein
VPPVDRATNGLPPIVRLALPLLLCASCSTSSKPAPDAGGARRPRIAEDRPENDVDLVKAFAALRACSVAGQIDLSCPQVQALRQQRATKRQRSDGPERETRTLVNLLESKSELTRLVAADALYDSHSQPTVTAAARRAFVAERSPTVKSALLRLLCWTPTPEVEREALALLERTAPEQARVTAADCLARGKPSTVAVAALRAVLRDDPSPMVRGRACGVVGELRLGAAVPEMAALLAVPDADWRCAQALAAVGDAAAYRALLGAVAAALRRDRVPVPFVAALQSFDDRSFFERAATIDLLAKIVERRVLSWPVRQSAARALGTIGGKAQLRRLATLYVGELSEGDRKVREAIERQP